jgi:hypothetical protein
VGAGFDVLAELKQLKAEKCTYPYCDCDGQANVHLLSPEAIRSISER